MLWQVTKIERFDCGKPLNYANRPGAFDKIFRGKLWTLVISEELKARL